MHLRKDFGFQDGEVAHNMAVEELTSLEYLFNQMPISWKWLDESGDPENILSVREGMLDYIGAAYALQERKGFQRGVNCFMAHSLDKTRVFRIHPAMLMMDLAFALTVEANDVANHVASLVLQQAGDVREDNPLAQATLVLARLHDYDYGGARNSAQALANACEAKAYSKSQSEFYGAWAKAVVGLASLQEHSFKNALSELDLLRFRYVNREITRCKEGKPSRFSLNEIWDPLTTALLRIAYAGPCKFAKDESISLRFSDHIWIKEGR